MAKSTMANTKAETMMINRHRRQSPFDWIGFGVLSLGTAAFQIMLDRGELRGWFGATEIIVEATLAGLGLYLFVVHEMLAERPFIPPRIFRDLNFSKLVLENPCAGAACPQPQAESDHAIIVLAIVPEFLFGGAGWEVQPADHGIFGQCDLQGFDLWADYGQS
jgi:hypothetical protein